MGTKTIVGDVVIEGNVDFTNAEVTGLSASGGSGMSYKEIYLTSMYSSATSATTNTKITGSVCIRTWLPDTEEITDFASVVALMSKLAGGTAANFCTYPAWGSARTSSGSVNIRIMYVSPTSDGGLQLLTLKQNVNDTTNNTMEYFSLTTALQGTVTVTTLM